MTDSPRPAPSPASALATAMVEHLLDFAPVTTASNRHDGWTPERQKLFIAALGVMGVIDRAAKAVGMSAKSAYKLRERPGAEGFASAWDGALFMGRQRAYDRAVDRAINGYTVPRFYRGKLIGTRHQFDNRMAMHALKPIPAQPGAAGSKPARPKR